jgi:signal transduction histidine kinase
MRRAFLCAVAVALIALLSVLLLNGLQPRTARLDQAARALDRFETAQHVLRRDIISVRAGLLHSYDPLVADLELLAEASRALEAATADDASAPQVRRLTASAQRQAVLTERLKSDIALLRNSLAYFSTMSEKADQLQHSNRDAGRLVGAILRLTLNTSSESQAAVDRRIGAFERRLARTAKNHDLCGPLLDHARLLQRLLPETDTRLTQLLDEDLSATRTELRLWIATQRAQAEADAQRFRLALYATAIALTLVLAVVAMKLISHLETLRRRSAFVQELARISADLVGARPDEVKPRLDDALKRLADHIACDAAFLWGEGGYACARIWNGRPGPHGDEWTGAVQGFALQAMKNQANLVRGPLAWPSSLLGKLDPAAALAVTLTNEEGDTIVLGFARLARNVLVADEDIDVVRLALDILGGAVRRSHFEQDRSALEARLEEARRMEAVGAFASGIAHNFNNIINAVGGYAEMASAYKHAPAAVVRHIKAIGNAVGRAQRLVDQILAYGRRSPDRCATIDVDALLRETLDMLRAAHGPKVRFDLALNGGPAVACGDAERLQQVVLNLATNGVQAMNGAGVIRIALRREVLKARVDLTTSSLPPGQYLVIGVCDQGVGIAPATLGRMFTPFFTTRAEGNGLGLATAAETAREFNGAIGVTSQLGAGSLFEFWISEAGPGGRRSLPAQGGLGETIMVVAGDEGRGRKIEDMVAALGYEPIGYADDERALAALRTFAERFDAVLVVGDDAARTAALVQAARQAAPRLPLLTIWSSAAFGAVAPGAPVTGRSLVWPVESADLARALRRAVDAPSGHEPLHTKPASPSKA